MAKYSISIYPMKRLLLLIFLMTCTYSYSLNPISEEEKTERLILVWGLLKYQHPDISRGKFDINEEFIREFNKIQTITTEEDFNRELTDWITGFDSGKVRYKKDPEFKNTKKLFTKNADFSWINESNFCPDLVLLLEKIRDNVKYGDYYASVGYFSRMASFKNETGYENFDAGKKSNRVLYLASFWNTMRYWNVNIYLTETPWNQVLKELVPEFLSENEITYELAKDKLFARLNDSHANFNGSYLFKNKSTKFSLYGGRIINDTMVIKTVFHEELAKKDKIHLGDLIYSINGVSLKDYYENKFSDRLSVSNNNYLKASLEKYFLLSADADSLQVGVIKKDGTRREQYIHLYNFSSYEFPPVNMEVAPLVKWEKLSDKIGYINLESINKSELKQAFEVFEDTKGIIIDLRNYPVNLGVSDVPSFLYPKKMEFMKVLVPFAPSYGKYGVKAPLRFIHNPFTAGGRNRDYYKGKIVLLVDRSTGSMAEYFGMAIQQAPNCVTMGEPTFGAVMNRVEVTLADQTTIDYTGMGAFYPDDTEVQRKGLKIDYLIQESALDYDSNLYIKEAMNLISN